MAHISSRHGVVPAKAHENLLNPQKSYCILNSLFLRTLGGTPNRDPGSLWGLLWGLPRDIEVI